MSSSQVPVAAKNFTNEHGMNEHGINYKNEAVAGVEFTGAPASSGETSQSTGQKVTDPSAVKEESTGKTKGSLAEEAKSFGH